MSRQSLTNFAVLLVCTWIVFSVKVQGILIEECRHLLKHIPIPPEEVWEAYVDLDELQACIDLWTEWRDNRASSGGISFPTAEMLTAQLNRMLTQQARQTAALRPVHPKQFERPNVAAAEHLPASPQEAQHEVADVQKPLAMLNFQAKQTTKAFMYEVGLELQKLRNGLPTSGRHQTVSSQCKKLLNTLRVTPNTPIPSSTKVTTHRTIVQDCAYVWEKLRDKVENDQAKKEHLQRELDLLNNRLNQIEGERNRRRVMFLRQRVAKYTANVKKFKAKCDDLVRTLPTNPTNLAQSTIEQMLKYKAELERCIRNWVKKLNKVNSPRKRATLSRELETIKTELTRVGQLIVDRPDVAAGPSGARRGRPKRPKIVALKSPPRGGSNRNMAIPRSKQSKKVRNRMVNDLQDKNAQMVKCEKLIRSIPNRVQAPLYYALLQYWTNLVDCIEMWEKLNGEARHTQEQKAIRTKELERMRTEKARVDVLINENTLGRVPNVPLTDENVAALNEDIEPESPLNPGRPLSPGSLNSEPPSSSDSVKAELNVLTAQLDECKRSFATLKPHEVGECARIDGEVTRINGRMLELEQIKLQKLQDNKKKVEQWMKSIPQDGVGHVQGPVLVKTGTKPNKKRPVDGGQGSQLVAKRPKVMSLKPVIPLQWSNMMPRPQATRQQLNEAIREKVYKPVPDFGKKSPGSNHSD